MTDIERQALDLFQRLTKKKKQAFIHHVQLQSLQGQKELPFDEQGAVVETNA